MAGHDAQLQESNGFALATARPEQPAACIFLSTDGCTGSMWDGDFGKPSWISWPDSDAGCCFEVLQWKNHPLLVLTAAAQVCFRCRATSKKTVCALVTARHILVDSMHLFVGRYRTLAGSTFGCRLACLGLMARRSVLMLTMMLLQGMCNGCSLVKVTRVHCQRSRLSGCPSLLRFPAWARSLWWLTFCSQKPI